MKKDGKFTQFILLMMIPLVVFVGMFLMNGGEKPGVKSKSGTFSFSAGEPPRTETPMGEYTRYFEKNHLDFKDKKGKRDLTYYWREPPVTPGMKAYPLVLVLHGAPGNAYAAAYIARLQDKYPAFILVPVLPAKASWFDVWPMKGREGRMDDVVALIRQLSKIRPIDPKRIYAIGCSEGGFGAFGAARYHSDLFAASVAISGGWPKEDAKNFNNIPLLVIHGAKDKNVPVAYSRDIANLSKQYGSKIAYMEDPNMGHECPNKELYGQATWDWLFSYHK
jgi:predicted peptidase